MLGIVLSGNLIQPAFSGSLPASFPSCSSAIGTRINKKRARRGAHRAHHHRHRPRLPVAGLPAHRAIVGSYDIAPGDLLRSSTLYTPALILIVIGAFTTSAQFPFHFWLPHAMAAPTPVSAYLHSATMVKARYSS